MFSELGPFSFFFLGKKYTIIRYKLKDLRRDISSGISSPHGHLVILLVFFFFFKRFTKNEESRVWLRVSVFCSDKSKTKGNTIFL